MYIEDLNIITPSPYGPYTTIQAAIQAALVSFPPGVVVIKSGYAGTDTYTNASGVAVLDLRTGAASAGLLGIGSVQGANTSGVKATASAAAAITAAAGGTFVTTLNAPGSGVLEGIPFTVKASGWVTFPAGTYTATIQSNLLYASTTLGFTASVAAAIVSVAAVTVTVTSATAVKYATFETEATICGDTTSGIINGRSGGMLTDPNGVRSVITPIAIISANTPTAVAFTSAAAPLQFLTGVILGSGAPATSVVTLNKFFLEV